VEHPRVNRRREQVIGRAHGVNVAREVEVKVLHRDDLSSRRRCAALDAERRALRGLPDAGKDLLAQMPTQRLTHADHRGGFALAQRRGVISVTSMLLAVGVAWRAAPALRADFGN